jgi:hypothetical protein
MTHDRIEIEREKQALRRSQTSEAGKKSAESRAASRVKAKPSNKRSTSVQRNVNPSSSSSDEDVCDSSERKIDQFAEFWNTCPRKIAKAKARSAWNAAIKKTDPEKIIAGMKSFAATEAGKEPRYIAHPSTWLNGERWEDEQPAKNDRFSHWKLPLDEREAFVKREMFSP